MAAQAAIQTGRLSLASAESLEGRMALRVRKVFHGIFMLLLLCCCGSICYWLFSSARYVSEAIVLVQNTDQVTVPALDITSMFGGTGGGNKTDQLLLLEHLQSVDMLNKLDAKLDLRSHYSDSSHDIGSRMWFRDASIEWFHRHYLSRVEIEFDDYAGVLRIRSQAYDATTAKAVADMLVAEGERFMNNMSHELARAQLDFLNAQVVQAQGQVLAASKRLLDFQNQKGLSSPKVTVESIYAIIAKLEEQRTEIQTQLASLPRSAGRNHPTRRTLQQQLSAVERQIDKERAKLASTSGLPLNSLVEEEQRLLLELEFQQDLYKTALASMEKGRMDTARAMKQVSVLQQPMMPEYPWEPRRLYGLMTTVFVGLIVAGILNLFEDIILDHVD
jgi:capsular polysaccharide transport system permease protein